MRYFIADLHIHTKLSPCASEEMTPKAIVETARSVGLDIIAVCDHNSSRNSAAVMDAGNAHSIIVIPGIELETRERIHVIGLFPDVERAIDVTREIRVELPDVDEAYTTRIGEQLLMRADGSSYGSEEKALASPSRFNLSAAVGLIQRSGGLAIAAHVERPSFSVYSQLGDVPCDVPFDALEVSPVNKKPIGLREKFSRYGRVLVASSDSHYLFEVGRARSHLLLESPTFEEIGFALHGQGGRSVSLA